VHSDAVSWQQVCTYWTGWNKNNGEAAPCRLIMPFDYVIEKFGGNWAELIERESEDDGTGPAEGLYADLKTAGYPALHTMLTTHPSLFSSLVMADLQTDFTGYVLASPEDTRPGEPSYFLQGLNAVEVADGAVIMSGSCYTFIKLEYDKAE